LLLSAPVATFIAIVCSAVTSSPIWKLVWNITELPVPAVIWVRFGPSLLTDQAWGTTSRPLYWFAFHMA
jgi:hypothetical protein